MSYGPERSRRFLVRLREKAYALFGEVCEHCGRTREDGAVLQFAHVRETGLSGMGRGMRKRYEDIIRNRDSYVLMCVTCHREFDRNGGPWAKGSMEVPF